MHPDKNTNIAIHIIEEIIEPLTHPYDGDAYYALEQDIIQILKKYNKCTK